MYNILSGDTFNELALTTYNKILKDGRHQGSRNGDIRCLNNVIMNLGDPRSRHLYLEGRNSNIIAQIAETFWVLAGDDKVDPYLSFYLPRAVDYSDDGKTWRGAYGPRLYMYDQLKEAIDVFTTDGLETRQSVIQILLPELDSKVAIVNQEGCESGKTKDRPCNNELVFFCTPNEDGSYNLNMNVMQRSGDAIWGALNINVFEWTVLQELVANTLNERHEETILLGEYTHFVTNLHIYDQTSSQAIKAISVPNNYLRDLENEQRLICTGDSDNDRTFFIELVDFFNYIINSTTSSLAEELDTFMDTLNDLFESNGVPVEDNLLFTYAGVQLLYTLEKKGLSVERINEKIQIISEDTDFDQCLEASKFFKFV